MEIIGKKCEVIYYFNGEKKTVYRGKIIKVFESGNILFLTDYNYLKMFKINEDSDYAIKVLDME